MQSLSSRPLHTLGAHKQSHEKKCCIHTGVDAQGSLWQAVMEDFWGTPGCPCLWPLPLQKYFFNTKASQADSCGGFLGTTGSQQHGRAFAGGSCHYRNYLHAKASQADRPPHQSHRAKHDASCFGRGRGRGRRLVLGSPASLLESKGQGRSLMILELFSLRKPVDSGESKQALSLHMAII